MVKYISDFEKTHDQAIITLYCNPSYTIALHDYYTNKWYELISRVENMNWLVINFMEDYHNICLDWVEDLLVFCRNLTSAEILFDKINYNEIKAHYTNWWAVLLCEKQKDGWEFSRKNGRKERTVRAKGETTV